MKACRILIAGAGALGSLFAAFLRRAGHHVTLLGRAPHLDAIARDGLRFEGIWGEGTVTGFGLAASPGDLRGGFDLAILAVKSYDTPAMARAIAPAMRDEGALLSVQNGLGNLEALGELFEPSRLLGAPVLIGAELPAPGRVRVTVYAKPVKIGAAASNTDLAARWATTLDDAGIPAEATDRLFPFLWEKVLYNAPLNPLGALLRATYGALAEDPDARAVMDRVIEEGFSVAHRDGVRLLWESAEQCRRHFYETLLPPTAHHRSSMLQDLERGRRTEIDAINGYIALRGEELGVPTPVNGLLTRLVRFAERRSLSSDSNRPI
jgi:2-dehydropantoate 2-reductase